MWTKTSNDRQREEEAEAGDITSCWMHPPTAHVRKTAISPNTQIQCPWRHWKGRRKKEAEEGWGWGRRKEEWTGK